MIQGTIQTTTLEAVGKVLVTTQEAAGTVHRTHQALTLQAASTK